MKCVISFGGTTDYGVKRGCKFPNTKECDLCRECHKYAKVKQEQYFLKINEHLKNVINKDDELC